MSKLLDKFNTATAEKQEFFLKDLAKELAKGQQFERLCQLLTDFAYLQVKLDKLGVGELIEDYDLVQNHQSWQELRLIQKALYMLGDILDKDTTQLAKELTRFLVTYQHLPNIKRFLKTTIKFLKTTTQYQDKPWLCLLSPTIASPLAQPLIRTLTGHSSSVISVTVTPDRKQALKIIKLIQEIQRSLFQGIGKPEQLKHDLSGCWSRRIDQEHRLVYEVLDDQIRILACRYHY